MRPIDAHALNINDLPAYYGSSVREEDVQEWIDAAPTLECEVVKHSNWELRNHRYVKVTADGEIHCPECHSVFTRIVGTWFKRCPECGTFMDGKKRDSL